MSEKVQIFQFHGTKQEKEDFHAVCDMLAATPVGQKLMDNMAKQGKVCTIEFDETIDCMGQYETGNDKILLHSFQPHPTKAPDKKTYLQNLCETLGHELCHAVTEDYYIKMIQNAVHLNEVLLATLLSETAARLVTTQLREGQVGGANRDFTVAEKDAYILSALTGGKQMEWVWPYIKRTHLFYNAALHSLPIQFQKDNEFGERLAIIAMQKDRFSMPRIPRPTIFDQAMKQMLQTMGSDLSVGDIREIRVPRKKPSRIRRHLQKVSVGKMWREFVMHHK